MPSGVIRRTLRRSIEVPLELQLFQECIGILKARYGLTILLFDTKPLVVSEIIYSISMKSKMGTSIPIPIGPALRDRMTCSKNPRSLSFRRVSALCWATEPTTPRADRSCSFWLTSANISEVLTSTSLESITGGLTVTWPSAAYVSSGKLPCLS